MSSPSHAPETKTVKQTPRKTVQSAILHDEARQLIPGGASSIMRWASYEPYPLFLKGGQGPYVKDVDDNSYIDYLLAFGALINGHAHPRIAERIAEQAQKGTMLGTPTELELTLARKFKEFVPSTEMVVFGNSGTDATSNAIRIARAATGKDMVLKFEGHYHGNHDYALVSVEAPPAVAGLEESPRSLPYSAGIPSLVLDTVIVSPWNNARALEKIMKRHNNEVAAIIMEPIMANSGVILPQPDFLKVVKETAAAHDALLIFDEVVTGFRVSPGGAQELYGVVPDLSTWGKAFGGGMPISALSGKKEYMELIGPGKVSYGGTYFSNSLTLAGAVANLELLAENQRAAFTTIKDVTSKLALEVGISAERHGEKLCVQSAPGMLSFFFTKQQKIGNYRQSLLIDWNRYRYMQQILLDHGVYLHPDNYERVTVSSTHSQAELEKTMEAFDSSFRELHERYA
jgi:glutamate-1-semialdehyde 2,1-aminomutase